MTVSRPLKKSKNTPTQLTSTARREAIAEHFTALLQLLGEDPDREGLLKTPDRIARSWETLFAGYDQDFKSNATVFENENYDEMVISKDIEFYSMCEHHMLPFWGRVHIGYIPADKIIGLSKLPRLVETYSRRLQNQERLTSQIAEGLMNVLKPKGVGVVIEAQHFCMMARGVQKQNTMMITSAVRGLFKKHMNTRSEFLRLIGKS
ncbi:MAG: GTP cyclohydrolase 1 [uncultured bacterium]|nr:MAG: GTP cyclohydrolase 1 [uncultured bacterium]KKT76231.1 MAG: GTP cyclohydrolase 1 [Candidatus Peregrinibacteria bacterium GW2011_GWA2_44_7]